MNDRYEVIHTDDGVKFGIGWFVCDIDPCPRCGEDVKAVRPLAPEAEFTSTRHLGARNVLHALEPYPCGCEVPAHKWSMLVMAGESAKWIPEPPLV